MDPKSKPLFAISRPTWSEVEQNGELSVRCLLAEIQIMATVVFSLTHAEELFTSTIVKMFTITGQVSVCGTAASVVYGLVLVLLGYGG